MDTGDQIAILKKSAPAFIVAAIFARLAADDLMRANSLAKTLAGEYPRAISSLAVARAVLDKKRPHPGVAHYRGQ